MSVRPCLEIRQSLIGSRRVWGKGPLASYKPISSLSKGLGAAGGGEVGVVEVTGPYGTAEVAPLHHEKHRALAKCHGRPPSCWSPEG